MRRIIMFNRVSADGCFAAADGSLGWIVPDPEFDRSAARAIRTGAPDTILFGRRTYQLFAQFWPHALDDASLASDPHGAGRRSPEIRDMATMLNRATKVVYSTSLTAVTWQNSRLVAAFDPAAVAHLKRQPGGDIMVFGSGTLVAQLTRHGLIDEYHLLVCPVFLGEGRRLMENGCPFTDVQLDEVVTYPSGNVLLRYNRRSVQ